ncbi:MAG: recombinase family protein [Pseudomonadales bacterium]
MNAKAVCYYRVSTNKQGLSGLGLEAQQEVARGYCEAQGLEIVKEFKEVQSGGKNDRAVLADALRTCRLTRSRLVVAKLDRISRDIEFIAVLQKSGIRFVCADMPEANETMIQFMSVFAQYERKMASERTKAALAAKKRQGVKLGNPDLKAMRSRIDTKAASKKGNAVKEAKANEWAKEVFKEIETAREEGCETLQAIADWLNNRNIVTSRGKQFTPVTVKRVRDRCRTQAKHMPESL